MDNITFNQEFKVSWDELTPSLQALFKAFQEQITQNRNDITQLAKRVDYLESIRREGDLIINDNDPNNPVYINKIHMANGKTLVEQWWSVVVNTSFNSNPEKVVLIKFPEPMDSVIGIQRDPMYNKQVDSNGIGWIDGDWWVDARNMNGTAFYIHYDSVHETNRNHQFKLNFHAVGYQLTGEAEKPPTEIPDQGGGEGSDTSLQDKLNDIKKLVSGVAPIGTIRYAYINPDENSWILANGQLLEREKYKDLYNWAVENKLIVTEDQWNANYVNHVSNKGLFSYGDGSTTFRLPDYRDIFIRGLDNGRGYDPNRVLGTEQLPTLIPGYDDNWDGSDFSILRQPQSTSSTDSNIVLNQYYTTSSFDYSTGTQKKYYPSSNDYVLQWFASARPRNIALNVFIKFQ